MTRKFWFGKVVTHSCGGPATFPASSRAAKSWAAGTEGRVQLARTSRAIGTIGRIASLPDWTTHVGVSGCDESALRFIASAPAGALTSPLPSRIGSANTRRARVELTRRQALAASAATLASAGTASALPKPADSLNSAAERSGRRFGSAVAWSPPGADRGSFANPLYAAILERECALLVPENELKWQWSRPAPDRFNFAQFDAIADYATTHGFKLRGHTLFWTPQ